MLMAVPQLPLDLRASFIRLPNQTWNAQQEFVCFVKLYKPAKQLLFELQNKLLERETLWCERPQTATSLERNERLRL